MFGVIAMQFPTRKGQIIYSDMQELDSLNGRAGFPSLHLLFSGAVGVIIGEGGGPFNPKKHVQTKIQYYCKLSKIMYQKPEKEHQ